LTVAHLRGCVEEYNALLSGAKIDDDLLAKVADRIGVLVVHQRQVELRLTKPGSDRRGGDGVGGVVEW